MPPKLLPKLLELPLVTEVHANPCAYCPTKMDGDRDPELLAMKEASREYQAQHVFICGWRTNKLCRGYVDYYGLTDEEVLEARKEAACSSRSTET